MTDTEVLALWRSSLEAELGLEPNACLDDVLRRVRALADIRQYRSGRLASLTRERDVARAMAEAASTEEWQHLAMDDILDLIAERDAAREQVVRLSAENDELLQALHKLKGFE